MPPTAATLNFEKRLARFIAAIERNSAEHKAALRRERAEREAGYRKEAEERKKSAAEHKAELRRERAEREAGYRKEAEERKKSAAEHDARLRKEAEAREKSAAEHDRQMAAIRSDFGGFTNTEGEALEDDTIHALDDLKILGDLQLTGVTGNMTLGPEKNQYDGLLLGPKQLVLVEVKHCVRVSDVRKFAGVQMPRFRRDYSAHINGKPLYGALVGLVVNPAARKLAEKEGLFVLKVGSKRRVKVLTDSTPAFRPRAY